MMGGKRTKNNTKPSSSGRSAELLGTSVPTLFGFAALDSASLPVVPGFVQIDANHSIDEMDPNLDDTLQIVLRKMLKKDRTTKTKALLEFIELMKNAELEVVKAVLPFWPKLFVNLSTDADHRVRETAQQAQAVIVSRAGKNIAPFLRQLIPAWISSQSDTYASAASVALQSFNNTFPPGKVSEVFVFCENEILEYFTKNLTVHTAITLSNPKSHSPEECENKYQLVLISSLRGYALYLSRIPAENLKKSAELNTKILESPKFWTYHKHKTAAIRSAWFEVMSALLQYGPFLVEGHQAQITTSVFQFLDEADPSVVTHVWALIVLVQAKLSEWHSHLNFDKAVFPKLWKLIKSGGAGNAACVFPHMLPLVSGFTREVLGNERLAKFYSLFFESMNEGLKTVQSSRLDVSAVSQAYYETFQYVVLQVLRDDAMTESEREEFCSNMLEQHLIGVIAWSITSEAACGKYVFQHMANLLDHWCQHSTTYTQYERLLVIFWERLYGIVKESVDNKNNTSCITDSHVDLIQNLRRTSHKRVKFAVENPSEDAVDGVVACPLTTGNHASRFESQLQLLVYRICQLYIAKISVDRDEGYILQLEYLVRAFQCRELFIFLANGSENIKCLFDPFARWLQDTKLQSEYIVELVMILYKYLNAEERLVLLNKWIKMSNAIVQRWIILRALSHPLCQEPNIRIFLAQPEVSNIITEWAVGVANGNTKDNMILLQKCFFVASNGEILIDAKTCEKIIDTITVPLQDALKVELHDGCISFLAQIMPVICSDARLTELHRSLFCTLFDFSVHNVVSDHLSEDTLWEATTAWQDALSGEDIELDNALLVRCIGTIDDRLRTLSSEKQDDILALLEKVSEIVAKLFACASEPNKHDKSQRCQEIHSMLEQFFAKRESEDRKQTEELSFLAEYVEVIQGKLLTKQLQQSTAPSISDQMFVNTMKSSFVRAICMLNVVLKLSCKAKLNPSANNEQMKVDQPTESDDRDEMETYENTDEDNGDLCVLHLWSESIYEKVLSVIYLATIGDTILYNSEELESVVECLILAVQEKLTLLLKNVSQDVVAQIKQKLFALSNDRGMLWAKSLTALLMINQYADEESGPVLLYEDASIAANNSEDLVAYVNIVQCLGAKMQPKCLPISPNLFENYFDVLVKLSSARCLIDNHFSTNYNEMNDRKIIGNCLIVLHELISRQATNKMLQYNCDLAQADENNIFLDMEVANVLTTVLRYFPTELDIGKWDFIRIALSSWTLSVSKSYTHFRTHNISLFIGALYRLFHGLMLFFAIERKRSSSELMSNVIEEWDNVFAKDVNLVLLKAFIGIVNTIEHQRKSDQYFIESICPYIESVDFSYVLKANKVDSKTSLDDLMTFSLNNIRHWNKRVRFAATAMLKSLSVGLIQRDLEQLLKRSESSDQQQKCAEEPEESWHLLQRFKHQLDQYQELLGGCIADFNYKPLDADSPLKLADNDNLQETRSHCLSFLLLWDCILGICAKAPSELRSIYAFWISGNKFEQLLLPILFKLMPQEILRNPDSCAVYGQAMFSSLEWSQIKNPSTKLERYACHLYTQTLRHLPVIVRRWFNGLNHRHSLIVSKITANSVSGMLCQEEFQSLIERKDRQDNMQIKVHSTLRQVMAVYSIDETKLELHITLPNNFPLGAVAVEGGKQIGGRLQSRQVVMQLSIFLTHQNGSIYDGLSLWKRNLDRKFEGVEECYVCYSVIHQDTCQLPKLSCKTCKKKFHGPCLYRWFSTSNKSTCPICRNIF